MQLETHGRSLAKAVSWRVLGTLATALLVFAFTGRLVLSLAVGAVEFLSKIGLFWLHERLWQRIPLGRARVQPAVIWLTGLSGAGKSTIAELVVASLRQHGLPVEHLDGDRVRELFPGTAFTPEERDAHVRRVGYLASRLERHGVFVVASLVSPFADSRAFVRRLCRNFVEVHVATPLAECERRDVKGLYRRARQGEIRNFTGIHQPYEPPLKPELRIDTLATGADAAARCIVEHLNLRTRTRHDASRRARKPQYSYSA